MYCHQLVSFSFAIKFLKIRLISIALPYIAKIKIKTSHKVARQISNGKPATQQRTHTCNQFSQRWTSMQQVHQHLPALLNGASLDWRKTKVIGYLWFNKGLKTKACLCFLLHPGEIFSHYTMWGRKTEGGNKVDFIWGAAENEGFQWQSV